MPLRRYSTSTVKRKMYSLWKNRHLKSAMRKISDSGYFDQKWYAETYRNVVPPHMGPLEHYVREGAIKGFSPGPRFNSAWYLKHYPDVAAAGINPLLHYLNHGLAEGRSPAMPNESELSATMNKVISSGFFDPKWYINTYPDVSPSYMGPLEHYVKHGAFEGRSPGPNFNSAWYCAQYPDIIIGRDNPLLHYLDYGAAQGRMPAPPPGSLEAARSTINSISDLEPELYAVDIFRTVERLPIVTGAAKGPAYTVFRSLFNSLEKPYDNIVFLPWLMLGGADVVAIHAITALIERYGPDSTLVIVADYNRLDAQSSLPAGSEIRVLSSFDPNLTTEERTQIVELIIRALQPRNVLNVNSKTCWDAFLRYGQAFATFTRLFAAIFCRDYTDDGRPAGYADTHLRGTLPFIHRIYFDNESFLNTLIAQFSLPKGLADKFVVLKQPVKQSHTRKTRRFESRRRDSISVFWASRFCRQKNIDLLMRIIELDDNISFDVWGWGEDAEEQRLKHFASQRRNLNIRGRYSSFSAIPLHNYNQFLYTSLWDGIPNVLLEVADAGIPIIASEIDGVKELVGPETGWLVADYKNPRAYLSVIYDVHENPNEALRRSDNMLCVLAEKHSWSSYIAVLSQSDNLLGVVK